MSSVQKRAHRAFLMVSALGALYVLFEIALQFFGRRICPTEGCLVIAGQARFGEMPILLAGLGLFGALFMLTYVKGLYGRIRSSGLDSLIDVIVIASLAAEGFFSGYQAFRMNAACLFCLAVLGLIVVLGILRLLEGRRAVAAGFASFAGVLSLFYLINPIGVTVEIPDGEKYILFYGAECPYCEEVIKDMDEHGVGAKYLDAADYASFLKSVGITSVPTLLVNEANSKRFITGQGPITEYLFPPADEPALFLPGGGAYFPEPPVSPFIGDDGPGECKEFVKEPCE